MQNLIFNPFREPLEIQLKQQGLYANCKDLNRLNRIVGAFSTLVLNNIIKEEERENIRKRINEEIARDVRPIEH